VDQSEFLVRHATEWQLQNNRFGLRAMALECDALSKSQVSYVCKPRKPSIKPRAFELKYIGRSARLGLP
jgi:hypothetical protein